MKMNKHYNELKASYLFVDIAHKVAAYQEAHPEKEIIRLGIGDVTQPLAKCVVKAMHDAADEMGTKEGFHGYGPEQGYPFLKQAIQGYYAGRGTQLAEDEIFISDGAKSDLANVLGLFDVDNTVLVHCPQGGRLSGGTPGEGDPSGHWRCDPAAGKVRGQGHARCSR